MNEEDKAVALIASALLSGIVGRPGELGRDPKESMKSAIAAAVKQARELLKEAIRQREEG
jgi:hypothetical protein